MNLWTALKATELRLEAARLRQHGHNWCCVGELSVHAMHHAAITLTQHMLSEIFVIGARRFHLRLEVSALPRAALIARLSIAGFAAADCAGHDLSDW